MANIVLALFLGSLWWFVRKDHGQYQQFKKLISTTDRQRQYRYWILKSFVTFCGLTILSMAAMGRLEAFAQMPDEFAGLAVIFRAKFVATSPGFTNSIFLGLLLGSGICLIIAALVQCVVAWCCGKLPRLHLSLPTKWFPAADIEALIPRNRAEVVSVAVLSINAGLSEELFFRLALPLVLTIATGDAALAFAVATVIFGAVHYYQGWMGIGVTTIAGGMFAAVYLVSGSIWLAVLLHALMDLNGLFLRACLQYVYGSGDLEAPAIRKSAKP